MKKEQENIIEETTEVVTTVEDENTEVEVEEKESLISKVVSGVKKHGKKIAVGAVVATGTIIGYALLKGSKSADGCESDCDNDEDIIDVIDFDEVDEG